MLTITIPGIEMYDELKNEFVSTKSTTLHLEHSLLSVARWESKWNKPYLSKEAHTNEEAIDYVRCMTVNSQGVDPNIYRTIPPKVFDEINKYITAPMTATTFREEHNRPSNDIITAEIVYWWMIQFNIPFECEKWHFNRLLTLIRVCEKKNAKEKPMTTKDIYNDNRAKNAARKAKLHSKG